MKSNIHTDHTLIIDQLERSIKFHNLDLILGFLPKGSYLVGGYIRDIILGRKTKKVDVDIVVPLNAIEIGKKIADSIGSKFIILDEKREVVRIILNHIYIDIANQVSSTIEGDLCSRDFSINSIAFLFDKKCLVDPLNGLKDLEISLLRTHSEKNLVNDPLRILRCFRFVSELMVFTGFVTDEVYTLPFRVVMASLAAIGVILTPIYLLSMLREIFFGKENPKLIEERKLIDAEPREVYIIACLLLPIIGIGLYPRLVTERYIASINNLVDRDLTAVKSAVKTKIFSGTKTNEILKAPTI